MSQSNLYSYADANGQSTYIEEVSFEFTGTWSETERYYASPPQAVSYGNSRYLCVTTHTNKLPTAVPTRFQPIRYWSPLVLMRQAPAATGDPLALASAAYLLAQDGTITANAATVALSSGYAGTVTIWASGTQGGVADLQVTVVNGIVTNIV